MKHRTLLIAAVVTLVSSPAVQAQSSSLFDVQFEANGTTYTLYDQTFPLELSVDDSGYGSFRDVFDFLYMVEALDHFTQYSESLYQSGDEASLSSNTDGGFTLTISRPFTGTIDLTGEYEYEEPFWDYDPDLDDYVEHFYTSFGSYGITISVPGYEPEPEFSAIVASSGDVGKVIGKNARLYSDVDAAALAGTTAEAMVAWLDMTNRTGLAIALEDAGTTKIRFAADLIDTDWAQTHRVALADWRLPSLADWRLIFAGCGGADPGSTFTENTAYDIGSIGNMLQTAGGTAFSVMNPYASSTTESASSWCFDFNSGSFRKGNTGRSSATIRACLAFDFVTPYDTWAATNGLGAADAVTDGTPNLIRYVFNCPTNACNPFAEISFVNGKPVVKTLAPVHTEGVSISLLSSTNLTDWSQADELGYTDFGTNGELIFQHDTDDPVRFYRLKVEE